MDQELKQVSIKQIQGRELMSPLGGSMVQTNGVVTGVLRRGFYIQTPDTEWDGQSSDAIFVYSQDWLPDVGAHLEVTGRVKDYIKHDTAKPVTQIELDQIKPLARQSQQEITPITLSNEFLPSDNAELAIKLNALEGMLMRIPAGQTFIAPSNAYADYVVALDAQEPLKVLRSVHGGVLISADNPLRWYPGFRVYAPSNAKRLNVGAKLKSDVIGPLHYRVDAYQIATSQSFEVDPAFIQRTKTTLEPKPESFTVMTLNCFNLDTHIESAKKVMNPAQDIDDDWGEGRFHTLAQAVVLQAQCPDIIALQEIQDNDGAEQTEVVSADDTYALLVKTIAELSGIEYQWVDIDPGLDADGGQPGGNIRNGYLYNPQRVNLNADSVKLIGAEHPAYEGSRKPLMATFTELSSGQSLTCINVHFASKRHQNSLFAPVDPGVDAKLSTRIEQAQLVMDEANKIAAQGAEFYITGDFNDIEHSDTLAVFEDAGASNLVKLLPNVERFDYNHRGKLQVLMHGIVSQAMAAEHAEYEILHGNELIGIQPWEETDKPSDHAYVIARLSIRSV